MNDQPDSPLAPKTSPPIVEPRTTRPTPLTITNLLARKVSQNLQVLRWDNDQYDRLCGYRIAFSECKNSQVLCQVEWPATQFPRAADYHYLLVWIEGIEAHSQVVLSVSAHSADRHGAPRSTHLAGWYETKTYVGPAAQRDPNAPVLQVSNPSRPDLPAVDIFQHDGTFRMNENCAVEELHGTKYSEVREWTGRGWLEVPKTDVMNQTIGGQRLPSSFPAHVDQMVLDIPAGNPELWIRFVRESCDDGG